MNPKNQVNQNNDKKFLAFVAWMSMLLVSDLPDIIWNMFSSTIPAGLFWAKVAFLAVFFGFCLARKRLRPLKAYAVVLLVFYLAFKASVWVGNFSGWQKIFGGQQSSFMLAYLGSYIRDLGVALAVIIVLWVIKRRRSEFFLLPGNLNAPFEPVRWLGIGPGASWKVVGWIIALVAGLGVMIPTIISIKPTSAMISLALPLLPAALLFSAINAFTEEVYFRASLLATLHRVLGKTHTLLISSVFFGLAHYLYGSPPGVLGFLMTGVLAWFLGKAMLETGGMFWPWFIHFAPDAVIFISYALLWVRG
jgi:membrane protease YdiL (CAAX protease family)